MKRIDYIIANFGTKLVETNMKDSARHSNPKSIVERIAAIDPSPNKRFLVWLCNLYVNNMFRLEDAARIQSVLSNFMKYNNRLPSRDIMVYKSIANLEDAVEPFIGKPVSVRAETAEIKNNGVNKVVDNDRIKIYQILTQDAAKFYGAGTRWCTAADSHNAFDTYKNGLFIIMIGKRKWQLHIESEQFMDERDETINDADLALICQNDEYTDFINTELLKVYTIVEQV